jgi:YVTN family beta-propeller protein
LPQPGGVTPLSQNRRVHSTEQEMRHDLLRHFLFIAIAIAVFAGCRPVHAQATITVGTDPVAIAINTATNKVYIANEFSDNVTVVDGSTNATRNVAVGKRPQHIAVNTKTNKIYVSLGTDSSLAVIDGATLAVTVVPLGTNGPITVDEATNRIYVLRSGPTDEVTILDGATHNWHSIAIDSYWPIAQALHSAARRLYVATYATGDIRVVDLTSTSDFPPTSVVKTWNKPVALALNPGTGRGYALTEQIEGPVNIFSLADNSVRWLDHPGHGRGGRAVAVNATTNRIYAAFEGEIMILDGATDALTWIPASTGFAVAVNPNSNKIYVPADDGTLAIINGANGAMTRAAIPAGAKAIAVNPATGRVYIAGPQLTVLEGGAAPPPPPPPPPPSSVNVQGLWWADPAGSESGWGINFAQQGEIVFATWFTYDVDGAGLWLVMSNGRKTGTNKYNGELHRTTGPAFNSANFDPAAVQRVTVGSATVEFSDANTGRLRATVNGVSIDKRITRQVFAAPTPTCTAGGSAGSLPNYTDLWWRSPAGSESGWGMNLVHQGDILFLTWFTYEAGGRGMWLVGSNVGKTGNATYSGRLYRTMGPAFNASPWSPSQVTKAEVGRVSLQFSDANNGTMTYTVNGATQSKAITRQVFSSPATVCR